MTRLSRRGLLGAAAAVLLSACRQTSASPSTATPPSRTVEPAGTVVPPVPTASAAETRAPIPTTPAAAVTTVTPTPRPTVSASPAPAVEQLLLRGDFLADPLSHDFNANIDCGGDATLWAGLLALDQQYNLIADWAASWASNSDASVWTFHLRPNNHGWSNGRPVTAADFVWSWRRVLDPATKAPHAWALFDIANAVEINQGALAPDQLGVAALDDLTLQVKLVGPRVYFPAIAASLASLPAYRPAVEKYGDQWTEPGNIVSNGPFTLTAWARGSRLATSRSTGYWNAAAITISRTSAPILSPDLHTQPYFDDRVDYLTIQPADLDAVRANDAAVPDTHPAIVPATWLLLPAALAPFDDPSVRQALAHVVDRKRLVEVTEGQVVRASSLLPPGFPGLADDAGLGALQQFDVDAALKALDGSSYEGGRWPAVQLAVEEGDSPAAILGQDIANQLLENLGIEVTVVPLATAQLRAAALPGFHLRLLRWEFLYADANNGYGDVFFPPGEPGSRLSPEPNGLRALVDRARGERDQAIRAALYLQCERQLQTQVAYLPLAHPVQYLLVHSWLQRFPARDGLLVPPSRLFSRLPTLLSLTARPGS